MSKLNNSNESFVIKGVTLRINKQDNPDRDVILYPGALVALSKTEKRCVVSPRRKRKRTENTKIYEKKCVKCIDRSTPGRYQAYISIDADQLADESLEIISNIQDMFEVVLSNHQLKKGGKL